MGFGAFCLGGEKEVFLFFWGLGMFRVFGQG